MENQEKLEELDIRIANVKLVIKVAEQELALLLEDRNRLLEYRPVWFTSIKKSDVKKTRKPNK